VDDYCLMLLLKVCPTPAPPADETKRKKERKKKEREKERKKERKKTVCEYAGFDVNVLIFRYVIPLLCPAREKETNRNQQ
jgi:hypothetical protein